MGWTWMHRDHGDTVKDLLAREMASPNKRILDAAIVNRTEYYAAVEVLDGEHKGEIYARVCLLGHKPRDGYNFGYKDMTEHEGPYYYNCPARILDRLTDPTHKNAVEWRAACRAKLTKPRVKPGDTVVFADPIQFRNGQTRSEFQYVKASTFRIGATGCCYRITGWKDRPYTVN